VGWGFPNLGELKFGDNGEIHQDPDLPSSVNFEPIHLGYNFTDQLGLVLQAGGFSGQDSELEGNYQLLYATLSGRYSFDTGGSSFVPYIQVGGGPYAYGTEDDVFDSHIDLYGYGLRAALGGQYYINRFYLAPELVYHYVNFTDGTSRDVYFLLIHHDYPLAENAQFQSISLMMTVGYHWKQ
jgi:hypothetical protein